MSKKEYAIFLKSKKVELENFLSMSDEQHRKASNAWSRFLDYRKKFYEQVSEYLRVCDILESKEFRRLV